MLNQLLPRLDVKVECSVEVQLSPAILLLPGTRRRTRFQVTEDEVSSEVSARLAAADTCNTVS